MATNFESLRDQVNKEVERLSMERSSKIKQDRAEIEKVLWYHIRNDVPAWKKIFEIMVAKRIVHADWTAGPLTGPLIRLFGGAPYYGWTISCSPCAVRFTPKIDLKSLTPIFDASKYHTGSSITQSCRIYSEETNKALGPPFRFDLSFDGDGCLFAAHIFGLR
jgi:hypothetical protein